MWERRKATAENVYIADTPSFVTEKKEEISIDYGGIPGDLHFGLTKTAGAREPMYKKGTEIFNRRQISIVSVEECLAIAERLNIPAVLPEWLGANIALSGLPQLTHVREGSRLVFPSGAALLCEGENEPCIQPGEVIQKQFPDKPKLASRFVRHAMGRRGIVCVVERPGVIAQGDQVDVWSYSPNAVKGARSFA
ncbi:molybdenum cofactor sulfurase [Bacillus glycinifermentans]|uniref:MOSC domain-containing protein n=1 Tax=Bacillus glycinifermentans TaxID=1664069 RepID=A0A0J6E7P9_9BACI|nr:MOSC domain-containing protein [Bacillus glycinifermentans]ATH92911.1 MOSC domain-containing protein [Bacillus glycinifermentans]KMM53706.1 molybdenum cofactor sulfurase [Bacillus glycinifermentans]KRT94124.1 molybdenum cofactor sulfurase [Bacillus glycinifermentans]MEC0486398.1 MOSC domain-containing protein [Bacillus glycinifermentans]MEC0493296.1 MOSC domain-containing protein [Bacillus glycinifermentans]